MGGRGVLKVETKMAVPRAIVPSSSSDSCLVETNVSYTCLSISNVLCVHVKGVY